MKGGMLYNILRERFYHMPFPHVGYCMASDNSIKALI